ncbi:hypothetical protein PVK06_017137 [Gossypium arboreum]|uniref:Uncharacterized protein n=1 Tax=Gossypium arboreum TaxID=29729 RepID=A0ABR0Q2L3_GOSAR|nr:hypothetical protein PVK06_017137 [Gossypium arboreum]
MRRKRENGRSFVPAVPKGQNPGTQRRLCFHDTNTSIANAFRRIMIAEAKKDCSFLEIYMENVIEESLLSDEINNGNVDVRLMGDELVVEERRVNLNFDEVDGYGGNLGDHDAAEGIGLGNR